jgi:radical SAM superfamily enzyme YgiQ (UPF0313 family)
MSTDILFIHPGNHKKTYQELSEGYTAKSTPVWTLLLADYVRRKGYRVGIFDTNIEGWDVNLINKHKPELIVIMVYGHQPSASTQTMPAAVKILDDIKERYNDIPIAIGGNHPSALPERTMSEVNADFVVQGEGPYTIEGLIKYVKSVSSIKDIAGLWYREDGAVKFTFPASLVKDLDSELSSYAWDLLPGLDNYMAHNMHCFQDYENSKSDGFSDIRSPYVALYTSLGCPFDCSFCMINDLFGVREIRYWSVDTVMQWIERLVNEHNVRNIRFDDELFVLNPERVEKLCDAIIERGYDLNIWVYARVSTIKESLLEKMAKAGFTWICLGIESGSESVRKDVQKSVKGDIKEVVRTIQNNGINILGNFMFGLPEDNMETMQQTLDLAIDLNCEFVNFYSVMAYPGSRLFETTDKKVLTETWNEFSQHSYEAKPLPTKFLTSKEVLQFRDDAFDKYFSNEKYLNMVKRKFGNKVHSYIVNMNKIKLKRNLLCN